MTGHTRLIPVSDARSWDAVVRSFPHYDTYHLAGYHEVASSVDGGAPHLLLVEAGAERVCLPFLLRDAPDGHSDVTSAYGYPGPLATGPSDRLRAAFGRAVTEAFSELGAVSAFVRHHPLIHTEWLWHGSVSVEVLGSTVGIDLTRTEDQIRSLGNQNHRRNLRRTSARDPSLVVDHRLEHLDRFVQLYEATMRRKGADAAYLWPRHYYDGLRDLLDRHVCLFHGVLDEEIATSILVLDSGSIVQYHLGGSSAEGLSAGMHRWTLEQVRRWATQQGRQWFHLGGGHGAARDSLFEFKASFAKSYHEYSVAEMIVDRVAYERLVAATDDGRPRRSGWFPAYRAPVAEASAAPQAGSDTPSATAGHS